MAAYSPTFAQSQQSFFGGGQTGAAADELKAACPAFASGDYKLISTASAQGNMPIFDVFQHETGARCQCTRSRTDKASRCGPSSSSPRDRSAKSE